MEDTYTILRTLSGSWGTVFLLVSFLAVVFFAFRPGSNRIHRDSAEIPFRHDDKPASESPDMEAQQ